MKKLLVVVGAQFGSEAKGHVTQRLVEREQEQGRFVHTVRVAGPNAGHTAYDPDGMAWALRSVPVAAVVPGPAVLGVSAGSEIDPPVFFDEIDRLNAAGLLDDKMVYVHGEATLLTDEHKEAEQIVGLVSKIGSTGKGIGAARADRLMRKAARVKDSDDFIAGCKARDIGIAGSGYDPANASLDGTSVIIEGTQGYGLGLHAGFYPQCTSSDCRAADFMAMAGIHSWQFQETEVWAVARIYPIRVAGNSGPLKDETSWEALGLPEERTTVTKKVRRVGMPDWDYLVREAVARNGGAPVVRLAVTMLDQMFPNVRDQKIADWDNEDWRAVADYVSSVEKVIGAKVEMVTTSPNCGSFVTDTW